MGRPAGQPNKNKRLAIRKLKDIYGEDFDPLQKMAEAAIALHERVMGSPESDGDYKQLVETWDKVAQYLTPKLKAVEQTHDLTDRATESFGSLELATHVYRLLNRGVTEGTGSDSSGEQADMGTATGATERSLH